MSQIRSAISPHLGEDREPTPSAPKEFDPKHWMVPSVISAHDVEPAGTIFAMLTPFTGAPVRGIDCTTSFAASPSPVLNKRGRRAQEMRRARSAWAIAPTQSTAPSLFHSPAPTVESCAMPRYG